MVWQRLMRPFHRATAKNNRKQKRRRLLVEQLVQRQLLATDLASITGIAFVDEAGDGGSAGDPPVAAGTQVQIFVDDPAGANPGNFDPGDLLVGTDFTDANGRYRFDRLSVGRYFVEQEDIGLNTPPALTVDVTDASGIQTALIDNYSQTDQNLAASVSGSTVFESVTAPEAIGNNRDVSVTLTSGIQIGVIVDSASNTLSIGSQGGAGDAVIQYDGADATVAIDPTGLGGVDLSNSDSGAGLIVETRADQAGDTLVITIHQDGANSATASVPVPQSGTNEEVFVPFSSFTAPAGQSVDFTNVGAIEVSVALSTNTDVFVSIAEARQPNVFNADIANIQPIELGGQVFIDNDQGGGQNNGLREGTEPGRTGVPVDLYQLNDENDVVDPATLVPIASTITGAGGVYSFGGLDPGHYAVVIPSTAFGAAAALFGFGNSTGNDPAPDPDDDVDDDDNGTTLGSGDVVSGTVTLRSNNEPTSPNVNSTLDFGFFPQIDLMVTKTIDAANSNVIAGGNATFDINITNAGPLDATNVIFEDVLPNGLTFDGTNNLPPGVNASVNGQSVEIPFGTVPAGTTISFELLTVIEANQTADITNTATVRGAEVDIVPSNNSEDEALDLVSSDLRIEKTDVTDPVNAGSQLTYMITVTNDGPDNALGVVVTDPLPAGVTFVSGTVNGNAALVQELTPGEVTATVGPLANGVSADILIVVEVDQNAASPLNNTATVTADPNTDPDSSNNSSSEDTTVNRVVDVGVDKSFTGTPVAGDTVTFSFTVTNSGPGEARGVTMTDTLQTGLTLVPGSFNDGGSGATLSSNGQDVTVDIGTLARAADVTFTFDALIDSAATGSIPNQATVTTTDTDNNATNDTSSVSLDIEQQVDLFLTKTVNSNTAVPGADQLVYTFVVGHDTPSPSDATNVVITDVLPPEVVGALISAPDADDTDNTNGTITVTYNSIPAGETRTFSITVDTDPAATGTVINPASVTSNGTDLDPSNNTDSAVTVLNPAFDITLNKTVDGSTTPAPGSTVNYEVELTNAGPSAATGVVLTDNIPTGLTFVSGTLNGLNATSDGTTVTFPAISLGANTSSTATLVFTVDSTADGLITNTATVPDLTASGETDATNNSASADITVTPAADLQITKTVDNTAARVGTDLQYTIMVTNDGPSQANNVVVTDTLPAGVTFVSGTGPNNEPLTESGGVVTVNGGNLANGGSFTFTINVTVAAGATGDQINSATVSSDTNDSVPGNNTATAETAIDPETSTISGAVYLDANNNGVQDAGEEGIAGVELNLTGTDNFGNAVSGSATTDANGNYTFDDLPAGTYTVTETQPPRLRDGIESVGTGANNNPVAADNVFSELGLDPDADAINFNFGELNEALSKRRFLASST